MKSIIGRGVFIAGVLVSGLIVFSATPSIADTLLYPLQSLDQTVKQVEAVALNKVKQLPTVVADERPMVPPVAYVATAYSLRGKTASGRMVGRGLIAADPRVLPLGSRVRLDHPGYSGEYLVADTGGMIRGRRIDIWIPSTREAMRFGRRTVKLTVLSYPAKRARRSAKG